MFILQIAKSALQLDEVQHEVTDLADSDWLEGICASYQPTCITDKLWIIPSWFDPKDTDAINIRVEPGLAFGTGEELAFNQIGATPFMVRGQP